MNKRDNRSIAILIVSFLVVFVLPLIVFKVPLQVDDLNYYEMIYGNRTKLADLYEFQRLPLEGLSLFYSYKLLMSLVHEPSENAILLIYSLFHLLSAILLYFFAGQLLRYIKERSGRPELTPFDGQLPLMAALLFLVMPVALDSYANLSLTVRNIGLPLALGAMMLKIHSLAGDRLRPRSLAGSIALLIAAISFYESNLMFILFGWSLLALARPIDRWVVRAQLIELLTIVLLIGVKLTVSLNNVVSRGMTLTPLHVAKSFVLYFIALLLPHIHGLLLWTSPLYLLAMLYLGWVLVRQLWRGERAVWALTLFIVGYLLGISFNPYIVQRALYGVMPILAVLIAWLLLTLRRPALIIGLSTLVLLASAVALWQFYYLQDRTYRQVASLIERVDALDHSRPQLVVQPMTSVGVRWLPNYEDQKLAFNGLPYDEIYQKDYSKVTLHVVLAKKGINTKPTDLKLLARNLSEMLKSNWLGSE